mmetsp:Transcript_44821/g.105518  ORF Transcript_44821/g.105518 Transcript_44821/m.105518 type:complete len:336 (+) Transcript_44821:37-1044(+)
MAQESPTCPQCHHPKFLEVLVSECAENGWCSELLLKEHSTKSIVDASMLQPLVEVKGWCFCCHGGWDHVRPSDSWDDEIRKGGRNAGKCCQWRCSRTRRHTAIDGHRGGLRAPKVQLALPHLADDLARIELDASGGDPRNSGRGPGDGLPERTEPLAAHFLNAVSGSVRGLRLWFRPLFFVPVLAQLDSCTGKGDKHCVRQLRLHRWLRCALLLPLLCNICRHRQASLIKYLHKECPVLNVVGDDFPQLLDEVDLDDFAVVGQKTFNCRCGVDLTRPSQRLRPSPVHEVGVRLALLVEWAENAGLATPPVQELRREDLETGEVGLLSEGRLCGEF